MLPKLGLAMCSRSYPAFGLYPINAIGIIQMCEYANYIERPLINIFSR